VIISSHLFRLIPAATNVRTWIAHAGIAALLTMLLAATTDVQAQVPPPEQVPLPDLAEDTLVNPVRFSGYGTLAYAVDDHDELAMIRDISQRPSDGYLTNESWRLDSRLSAQASYQVNAQVGLLAQAGWRDQVAQDLNSILELGFVKYRPTNRTALRLGRIGFDVFLMSDHRNLGYAYNWVRPPSEYHSWIPIFSVDGVDMSHSFEAGSARWRIKGVAGNSAMAMPIGKENFKADIGDLYSLTLTRESGPWRMKLGATRYHHNNNLPTLEAVSNRLLALGQPEATTIAEELDFKGSKHFVSLGLAYDDGVWTGQTELGRSYSEHEIASNSKMAYLAVGRRFNNWTPFFMAAISKPNQPVRTSQTHWGSFEPLHDQVLHIVNSTRFDQKTLSLGLRWDVHERAAVKVQWDHSWIAPYGYATWFRAIPLNTQHSQINVGTVSLDFTF